MANKRESVVIPDLGGANQVDVLEVLVNAGDRIAIDDPLLTLEGDKATMDIPAPVAGVVVSVTVAVGDKVSEGDRILEVDMEAAAVAVESASEVGAPQASATQTVVIPDIGGDSAVDVLEILVAKGDIVAVDQGLLTLEGDKATMDIPSPFSGTITEILLKPGDKVRTGDSVLVLTTASSEALSSSAHPAAMVQPASSDEPASTPAHPVAPAATTDVYAGPAVRRIAMELNIPLSQVRPTGEKGRITKADLKQFLSSAQGGSQGGAAWSVAPLPTIDFAKFGRVTTEPLSKIKKISGANLHRNWVSIPHVTQFQEADITDMEAFRQQQRKQNDVRLTPLVFLMKAAVAALRRFPHFNASLSPDGEQLVLKSYFHIGVAVDTPAGLVVPVIRDVDQKGLVELSQELSVVSKTAREKGLSMAQMQGGCFSISSLGGIGGTAFTPIINAPEVAILGVSRSQLKPIYCEGVLEPRLMLPLSLSYDHRVIDGADGARFLMYFSECLADLRSLLL